MPVLTEVHRVAVEGQHPVKLFQRANGKFLVTYGSEVKDHLGYVRAAEEFGYCVFHALACNGQISSEAD